MSVNWIFYVVLVCGGAWWANGVKKVIEGRHTGAMISFAIGMFFLICAVEEYRKKFRL